MSKIAVISPSSQLTAVIERLLVKNELPIILAQASQATAVIIAQRLIETGIEILVSRGRTAELLRESVSIPVVEIQHTFLDCFNAYQRARVLTGNIAFLATSKAYSNMLNKALPLIGNALICQIDPFDKIELIHSTFEKLKHDNIRIVIGGLSMQHLAMSYGMEYVMSEADPDAIRDAVNEALHLLKLETERKRKNLELEKRYEMVQAIFNCVSEGVLSIDSRLKVTNINKFAINYLGPISIGDELKKGILRDAFLNVLHSGESSYGVLIDTGRLSLCVNISAVILHEGIVGAVACIQNQHVIKKIEQKMRSIQTEIHKADKTFSDIIGNSPALLSAKSLARKYAAVNSTVLIEGESGTGKELFAQSIHNASSRASGPFVAINCAAFAATVIESELFGYVKGAFTGALQEGKAGVFELAHTGTIFLDEISEISFDIQLKLLRTLQERKIIRMGDSKLIPVDIRIIAASNKNLSALVEQGKFREDFYYRICVLRLLLPSLKQRKTDIPYLFRHLMQMYGGNVSQLSSKTLLALSQCEWPGNVRQLANVAERLIAMAGDEKIDDAVLAVALNEHPVTKTKDMSQSKDTQNIPDERSILIDALRQSRGNRQQAAKILGISSTTLWRRIKKYKQSAPDFFEW